MIRLYKRLTKQFPIVERDELNRIVYHEGSHGYWWKREYKDQTSLTVDSTGFWSKREYDDDGQQTNYEDSNGHWSARRYNEDGKNIFHESECGIIIGAKNV